MEDQFIFTRHPVLPHPKIMPVSVTVLIYIRKILSFINFEEVCWLQPVKSEFFMNTDIHKVCSTFEGGGQTSSQNFPIVCFLQGFSMRTFQVSFSILVTLLEYRLPVQLLIPVLQINQAPWCFSILISLWTNIYTVTTDRFKSTCFYLSLLLAGRVYPQILGHTLELETSVCQSPLDDRM